MMEISSKEISETSSRTVPTKQAWAAYVRRRWPRDCLAHVMRVWGLTEGEARGAVFGTISQRVIDKILAHRNGGVSIALSVEATAWGLSTLELVSTWMEIEERAASDERARGKDAEQRMVALARRLHVVAGGRGDPADC